MKQQSIYIYNGEFKAICFSGLCVIPAKNQQVLTIKKPFREWRTCRSWSLQSRPSRNVNERRRPPEHAAIGGKLHLQNDGLSEAGC